MHAKLLHLNGNKNRFTFLKRACKMISSGAAGIAVRALAREQHHVERPGRRFHVGGFHRTRWTRRWTMRRRGCMSSGESAMHASPLIDPAASPGSGDLGRAHREVAVKRARE